MRVRGRSTRGFVAALATLALGGGALGVGLTPAVAGAAGAPKIGAPKIGAPKIGSPKITVTPSTGLVSGQTVQVKGSGFPANQPVIGLECVSGATDPTQCDATTLALVNSDTHGAFSTPFTAHRTLLGFSGAFSDCAPTACELLFALATDFTSPASAPLAFNPKVPLPPTTMKAKPSTNLADLQSVTVSGSGFNPNAFLVVEECVVSAFACGPNTEATALPDGRFFSGFAVRRMITDANGTRVDCATVAGACEFLVFDDTNADYHATTPLEFDPNLPPPPPPTLKVSPSTKLPFYARVTVSGKNWTPGDFLFPMECESATSFVCAFIEADATPDSTGAFTFQPMLQREIADPVNPANPPFDCAAARAKCVLEVLSSSDNSTVTAPLSFDPNATIPPPPSVTTEPSAPFRNNQVVKIKGQHFAPSAMFDVGECASTADSEECTGTGSGTDVTSATGALATQFQVQRLLGDGLGDNVDCNAAGVQCSLQISSEGGAVVNLPLQFKKGAATTAAPARVVRRFPSTGVVWAQPAPSVCGAASLTSLRLRVACAALSR